MDNLDHNWLENIRSETLTSFFKIFPHFASDYFYIIVLAVGYWALKNKKLFIDLGFLVPLSTLINIILKNTFMLPRPPQSLHLVPYHIDYGFPSGDVQVGLVFWGMIFLNTRLFAVKSAACFIVTGISFSRIYLGVHSIYDVIGGLTIGGAILIIYNSAYFQAMRDRWIKGTTTSYWCLISIISLVYISTILDKPFANFGLAAVGTLIGLGISFMYLRRSDIKIANIFQVAYSLIALFLFYKFFPIYKTNEFAFYISAIVKYAMLVLIIYVLLPLLHKAHWGVYTLEDKSYTRI